MEEQKKKGILTRSKRKLEMDDVPIAYMEEQKKKKGNGGKRKLEMDDVPNTYMEEQKKKKKKGNGGKRKLEMDDVPNAYMEEQKKENLTLGKRKIEMDDVPITYMEEQKKQKKENLSPGKRKIGMDDVPIAYNKRWKLTAHGTATTESPPHHKLPHEVIVDDILPRLPIWNLAKECALVCKFWYESIKHPHFAFLHALLQSADRNPNLIFDLLNTPTISIDYARQCTLRLDIDDNNDNHAVRCFRKLTDIASIGKQEPVGHCNGLQCIRSSCVRGECFFHITNPSCRPNDFMAAVFPVPDKAFIFCCGFGFDSLVNEYKIVLVYSNSSAAITDVHDKFKCMVFTLGSKSWRESSTPNTLPVITISTGVIHEKKKKVILSRMSFSRSAIYVGGALYWRVLTRDHGFGGGIGDDEEENQEKEMLLFFDIHHEQFQLISLPLEIELKMKTGTKKITRDQGKKLIDHRLLEFEGSPCIVRLQSAQQQQRNNNDCCKVHLYVLKDRVKSAWSIETFDVFNTSMTKDMSNPPPCIITTAASSTTTTTTIITTATTIAAAAATTTSSTITHAHQPITHILCVSGRVILYWFDGVCVQLYDLRKKRLQMVKYTPADPTKDAELFNRKVRGQVWPFDIDDFHTTNKLIYCRRDHIDYKLHIYVENSLPLKTFIPKGCTVLRDYEKWYSENKDIEDGLGFVFMVGENRTLEFHCFCQKLSSEGLDKNSSSFISNQI
ncbi:uncharacterized protein LOC113356108 [Papaver somniferum]|uniref:uncharacterized protein LOC113356108 n=1 Tax=Papaver somniferum TaxID=3469 RepID=UPI000E6FFCBD|nr:uncharacterized protein LOC113356108 [Papaver somniferum]